MLFHVVCRILYVLHGNVFPRTLPDSQKIPDFILTVNHHVAIITNKKRSG